MNEINMKKEVNAMKDCYELKNPKKNPYAERMKNGYTIIIERDKMNSSDARELESNKESDVLIHPFGEIVAI